MPSIDVPIHMFNVIIIHVLKYAHGDEVSRREEVRQIKQEEIPRQNLSIVLCCIFIDIY